MFEWHPEEGKLLNYDDFDLMEIVTNTSREDKIEFADSKLDGKLSYVLDLFEKYKADRDNLPKDNSGRVRTVSLKAWLRKNDKRKVVDIEYKIGRIVYGSNYGVSLSDRNFTRLDEPTAIVKFSDYADEIFYSVLKRCVIEEKGYLSKHDEYIATMRGIVDQLHRGDFYTFGSPLIYGTGGLWLAEGEDGENRRRLTLDEMKLLISLNEQVQDFVKDLSSENNIDFDNPIGKQPDKKKLRVLDR